MIVYRTRLVVAAVAAVAVALALTGKADDQKKGAGGGQALSEDGRIGKVTDSQGLVSIKPVMCRRWTPVSGTVILKPEDWLRTDVRGANAVELHLAKDARITLGPGTLVELTSRQQIKLFSGEMKISTTTKSPVELVGPKGKSLSVSGVAMYRLDARSQQIVAVEKPPIWLQGFESATAHDSIGSLVANIDGRNVPLTVGYHKVTVDIRDQIARTVIEESFVNRTDGRLEGVFYFPLPQDSSISGFGMWIGNELVEADVVEKQRAREIYETILRERRDPGLLEWTGGNLFKARVFPIEAHSEKRIKITYTQVLPMRSRQYRYSYGLQSEMLNLHPLRELTIDVRIHSAVPLADVSSPTHLTRIDKTEHSAHVEFAAQEYTPDRDFEIVVTTGRKAPNKASESAVMIPHRRGEDGYFMLLVTPPISDGAWQRETLPDGKPLRLLILADTSGSMDASSRKNQEQFVASLLSSLTPDDRFNLATCDVGCEWAFRSSQPANDENTAAGRDFLTQRVSLGWTDLDRAFASALERCDQEGQTSSSPGPTHVIYVGDGVVNTINAAPMAFSKRLRMLCEGKDVAFHAVSVGSSSAPVVLKTIASLGGGSVRQISGERTPQTIAVELLGEMTQPVFRDLNVTFEGLRVARVYPRDLPNLPAGTQQILLGRYLPGGDDQQGKVVVTGQYSGKPVRFSTDVSLPKKGTGPFYAEHPPGRSGKRGPSPFSEAENTEHGNSFVPRLWARMHLDELLQQGASDAIKDEIIVLSEEYHIITPYTSLLVLESDADRERFKVDRRFQMRDGEKFFAEGRDQANFDLLQKQMKLAGNWRLGLRRQVLRDLMGLGRDLSMLQPAGQQPFENGNFAVSGPVGRAGAYDYGSIGGASFNRSVGRQSNVSRELALPRSAGESLGFNVSGARDFDGNDDFDILGEGAVEEELRQVAPVDKEVPLSQEVADEDGIAPPSSPASASPEPIVSGRLLSFDRSGFYQSAVSAKKSAPFDSRYLMRQSRSRRAVGLELAKREAWSYQPQNASWLTNLFPAVAAPPVQPEPTPEKRWPADTSAIAESLLRTKQLSELPGGLVIHQRTETFDPRWSQLVSQSDTLGLVSRAAWLTRSENGASQTLIQWCDEKERGVLSTDMQLGRRRKSEPADLLHPPLGLNGCVQQSMERTYLSYSVRVQPQDKGRTLLVLTHPSNSNIHVHVLIDNERHVILWIETRNQNKVTTTTRFEDFVEVVGAWWATRVETLDNEGRRTSVTTREFRELTTDAFVDRMKAELEACDRVQFLHEPIPEVGVAKQAVSDGTATFDDRMALAVHFAEVQNWDRVFEHLAAAEQLADVKAGMRWVRNAVLNQSRRREELRQRLLDEAASLTASPQSSFALAEHVRSQASSALEANEMLRLLDVLKPIYERQPDHLQSMKRWARERAGYLEQTGQSDQMLQVRRELAERNLHDSSLQREYAQALSRTGEYAAAYAWLDRVITPQARWLPHEEDSLRSTYADFLRQQGRSEDLVAYLARWMATNPPNQTAYAQYLSALVHADNEKKANRLIAKWIKRGRQPAPIESAVSSRLGAAVSQALGQGHNLYTNRIDERWLTPLAETALFFAAHESHTHVADQIMNHWQFQKSDACRDVRRKIAVILTQQVHTLPAKRLPSLVNWIMPNDPALEARAWRTIAKGIERRWSDEQKTAQKDHLAAVLIQILSSRLTAEEHLAFLRRQLQEGPEEHRATYARQLFDALLSQPWTADCENEAFSLLPRLSDAQPKKGTGPFYRNGPEGASHKRGLSPFSATPLENEDDVAVFVFELLKYRLLVALDRPKELEKTLRVWIRPGDADNDWRLALGYLSAEQGQIDEAIALFEKIEAADELSPSDYRALASWYLVAGDQDRHERALVASFKWTEEWQLQQWLYQQLQPWRQQSGELPGELDKDVLRVFAALFQKASHPQNYEWQLREFYRATRDFRLLAGLADGVVGHTAGRVYPFLQGMRSVLDEIRDEATADSIVEHIAQVRQRATSAVDHRALDLLEVLIERRSAEVLNQPGPHIERALAALQRAFRREWSAGEPRLMADLLADLGHISQKRLADEQIRQLESLHKQSEAGTIDRLHIAHALARAYWSYSRHREAIEFLEAALAEHEAACGGVLPSAANGSLDTFIGFLEGRRHFARGEKVVFEQLEHPVNRQQTFWLRQRLYRLYKEAIEHDGDVSLGSGQTLYQAATGQLQQEMDTDDHNHRHQLVNQLCSIYRTAKPKNLKGVIEDLRAFAFQRLPDVLKRQTNNYQSLVNQVAHTLHDVAGSRHGLEFLIERIEHEPSWFRLNNQDGWNQYGYQLARWRSEVGKDLGDLEPRLLQIVVNELKKDLRTQQAYNRSMYDDRHGSYFWSEKSDDFAQAADEVYEEHKQSGSTVQYISDYLYWGLDRHARAIEILLSAYKDGILDEAGQSKLVAFLHRQQRYGESIPILEPLVERRPETMQYRVWLMQAYFRVGRQQDLLALLKHTDDFFHQDRRWQESAIAELANSCLENELYEQSVAYHEEVINLNQRTQPGRGIGTGTLSTYYSRLARAYFGLKKTAEAVDAACGAIISWGPRHDQRANALTNLRNILANAADLDAYATKLDRQTEETGLHNPMVRKALGNVYFDKGQPAKAIPHLKLAIELQPNDTETHQKLVACYDQLRNQEAAISQLLDSVRLSRRNIQLYKDLAGRYEKLKHPAEAERAYTSIIEALPNESESHTMLAEIRQSQGRWSDAIPHWQQVAQIRALEPTGLLKLAEAQIHEKQWDAAMESVRKLRARTWPDRFGDVDAQARNLERQVEETRP